MTIAVAVISRQRSRHLQDVREWARRVIEAQDQERATIARDLHDGVIQDIHAARLGLLARGDADDCNLRLVGVIDGLRSMARGLHPAAIDSLALREALADLAPDHDGAGPRVAFTSAGDEGDVPLFARRHLYRVAQQALANALTHARATTIVIDLRADGDGLALTVTDDGVGIAPDHSSHGLGMRSMAERMAAIGGTLAVVAAAPHGTAIRATLPRSGTSMAAITERPA